MTAQVIEIVTLVVAGFASLVQPNVQEPQPTETEPVISTLDFRISPLMDLMMYVRTLAEEGDKADISDVEGLREAVRVVDEIAFEARDGWGIFTGPSHSCTTAAEMVELARQFPEKFTMRSGQTMDLRRIALKMANALAQVEAAYLKELWPQRETSLKQAVGVLEDAFEDKQREIYAFVQDKLDTSRPQVELPIYVVVDAPWPGAMTYMSRGGSMCFVGLNAAKGSQLLESVIHETLHVLDSSTRKAGNVFTQMEQGLRDAGLERGDRRMRDVPHMVMFVQAAETVRRLLDPEHVDYGDTPASGLAPYYERDKDVASAVRPVWRAYLDSEIGREEAVKRIVEKIMATERE